LDPKNFLVSFTCLILPALGACQIESTQIVSLSPPEESLVLQSEVVADQLATKLPITLVYESSSWTIKLVEILVDDWRAKWAADEQKMDTLLATIAAELDKAAPAPELGPNDYLIDAGGPRLDKETAKTALRETLNAGERKIALKVDQIPPQVEKLLRPAPPGGGVLYLTFDDAMLLSYEIMAVAESYGAQVTFFPTGDTVVTNPGVAAAAVQRGHAVQTHGYSHIAHAGKSLEWQINNIQQGVNATYAATGVRPTLFRPPYGSNDADTYKAAAAAGVLVMLWNTSSIDTRAKSPEEVRQNVLRNARDGSVVLMHSWSQNSLGALPQILAAAKEQGYRATVLK
jgi:peptidoglycan/xylan/chitin deacetylase (PgdA/CDA1 family)